MLTTLAGLPASAADSARAAASVYTASLLATAPIVAAAIGAFAMRRAAAEGRVLVWRVAVVMLLVALAGRLLPLRLAGWSVPSIVADAARRARAHPGRRSRAACRRARTTPVPAGSRWIQIAFAMYVAGVVVALLPTALASIRARRMVRRARALDADRSWMTDLEDSESRLAVRRRCSAVSKPRRERPDDVGPAARGDSSAHCGGCLDRGRAADGAAARTRARARRRLGLRPCGALRVRALLVPSRRVVDRPRSASRRGAGRATIA